MVYEEVGGAAVARREKLHAIEDALFEIVLEPICELLRVADEPAQAGALSSGCNSSAGILKGAPNAAGISMFCCKDQVRAARLRR